MHGQINEKTYGGQMFSKAHMNLQLKRLVLKPKKQNNITFVFSHEFIQYGILVKRNIFTIHDWWNCTQIFDVIRYKIRQLSRWFLISDIFIPTFSTCFNNPVMFIIICKYKTCVLKTGTLQYTCICNIWIKGR